MTGTRCQGKTIFFALLFFASALTVASAYDPYKEDSSMISGESYAGSAGDIRIPPGMELIKIGDVNVIIPRDAQLRKVNDLYLIESAEEYAARKFEDTEGRLGRIERELAATREDLRILQNELRNK